MNKANSSLTRPAAGRKSLLPRLRLIVGTAVLLGIFAATWANVAFSPCVWLRVGPITLMCPLGFLEISLAGRFISFALLPGFIIVCLLIFAVGRAWCGWVCPASLAGAAASGVLAKLLPESARKRVRKLSANLKTSLQKRVSLGFADAAAVLAGLLAGTAFFAYPAWSVICPLGVVSRNIISLGTHLSLRLDLLFLLLPLAGTFLVRGGWKCVCPVGIIHGSLSAKRAVLKPGLKKDNACNQCGICRKMCPVELSPALGSPNLKLCTRCGVCIEKCPRNCLTYKINQAQDH